MFSVNFRSWWLGTSSTNNSWLYSKDAIFYGEGSQLWALISQWFFYQNSKFQCSLDWKFPEFFKTHPTFIFRPFPRPVMSNLPLITVFFGTPCRKIKMDCSRQVCLWIWARMMKINWSRQLVTEQTDGHCDFLSSYPRQKKKLFPDKIDICKANISR